MGKHSAPESPGFWRAVIIAGLRWLIVLALIGAFGYGIYKLAFDRAEDPAAEGDLSPLDDPFLQDEPTPLFTETAGPEPEPTPSESPQPTGETQVLDGSNSQARLDAAVDKLKEAGYEVVATGTTSSPYEETHVFYQEGQQQMAEAVASLLDAPRVEPVGDRTLDPNIPVSVVIGPDYAG